MKRKAVLIILFALIAVPAIVAMNLQAGVQYDFFFPQYSHNFTTRFDLLWSNNNKFFYGATTTLGYGFEIYKKDGSNAAIYGYSFSVGPEIRYSVSSDVTLGLCVKALVAYALYPVILRGEADIDVIFELDRSFYLCLGSGFLFPEKCALAHILFEVDL